MYAGTGVIADLDPPRIGPPRSKSASGYGPPGPYPLADLDSPDPYPLADLDHPSADLDPLTKLSKNITMQNFLVESDNNSESRLLEKFFRKYVFEVGTF